ncbi:MAG: carboxypeptidase-like regulatory domain-containing protein, partial [Blastocatellia bacterium]
KSIGTRRNNGERTNSLGEFHLQGLRPGFYAASIKTGNNREIYSEPVIVGITDSDAKGIEIKVLRRAATKGDNDPTALMMGSITGRVVAEDGSGMANVPMMLWPVGSIQPSARRTTTADEEGKFEFANLPARLYRVSAGDLRDRDYVQAAPPAFERAEQRYYRIGDDVNISLIKAGWLQGGSRTQQAPT